MISGANSTSSTSLSGCQGNPLALPSASIEAEIGMLTAVNSSNSEISSFAANLGKLIGTVDENGEATEYSYPLDRLAGYVYDTGYWLISNIMQGFTSNTQSIVPQAQGMKLESQDSQLEENLDLFEGDKIDWFTLQETTSLISQADMVNIFSLYFDYIEKIVLEKKESARLNGKELLIFVGEGHVSYAENYIQHIILNIAKKLNINNFYHERSEGVDLNNEIGCGLGYGLLGLEDIEVAQKYGMKYVPIDLFDIPMHLHYTSSSPATTRDVMLSRNKRMVLELNEHAQAGVAIVGGNHMIGLSSSLEGNKGINSDVYEVLDMNLFETQYMETIKLEYHEQAKEYYSNQNSVLFTMVKNLENLMTATDKLNESLRHKVDTVERAFSDFIGDKDQNFTINNKFLTRKAFSAVRFGDEVVLQKILSLGFNIDTHNCQGFDLLKMAIFKSNLEMAKFLLKNGIDSTIDRALMLAVQYGQTEMVSGFLEAGANVNAQTNGKTPLHFCAEVFGRTEILTLLLENVANIDAKDNTGFTPLHLAVMTREAENAIILLTAGADTVSLPTDIAKMCERLKDLPANRRTRHSWR